eukprot:COSAG01_NODE_613_length_14831_cov_8.108675_10_plen_177_part_00
MRLLSVGVCRRDGSACMHAWGGVQVLGSLHRARARRRGAALHAVVSVRTSPPPSHRLSTHRRRQNAENGTHTHPRASICVRLPRNASSPNFPWGTFGANLLGSVLAALCGLLAIEAVRDGGELQDAQLMPAMMSSSRSHGNSSGLPPPPLRGDALELAAAEHHHTWTLLVVRAAAT